MQTRSSTHVPHAQWTFYVLPSLPRAHNTSQHINQPRAIGQGGLRTPQGAPALTFVSVWTSCAVYQNTDVKPHTRQSGAIVARQCICQVRLMQYQYACLTAARETHGMPPTAQCSTPLTSHVLVTYNLSDSRYRWLARRAHAPSMLWATLLCARRLALRVRCAYSMSASDPIVGSRSASPLTPVRAHTRVSPHSVGPGVFDSSRP